MGEKKAEAGQTTTGTPQQPVAGPGVGSLLQGTRRNEKNIFAESQTPAKSQEPLPSETRKALIPRWYFFAADLCLIGFALAILFRNSGKLEFGQAVICVASIVLAGILGVMGVWMGRKE